MIPGGKIGHIVVLIDAGGRDGHYLLQSNHPTFRGMRPTLALPDNQLLDIGHSTARLNFSAPNMAAMTLAGEIAWYHNTGLVNMNDRGHDSATSKVAVQNPLSMGNQATGFLAKIVNHTIFSQSGFAAISLGANEEFLAGTENGQTIGNLSNFGSSVYDGWGGNNDMAFRENVAAGFRSELTDAALQNDNQRRMVGALRVRDNTIETLKQSLNAITAGVYPNTGYGNIFRDAARLMKLPPTIGTFITVASHGGFDTHNAQAGGANQSIAQLDTALATFKTDLGPDLWSKTAVVNLTEFGRTAKENGSMGTDHGYGGITFVAGGAIAGGVKDAGMTDANLNPPNNWFMAEHNIQNILATLFIGLDSRIDVQACFPGINVGKLGNYSNLLK